MNRVLDLLISAYEYDIAWLTTPWVCWTVIPAVLYVAFMFVKWSVLTCPVWIPLALALKASVNIRK